MIKGLEALEEIKKVKTIIPYRYVQDEYSNEINTIEKELKEYEQYKAIEEKLGTDLITYFRVKRHGYIYYKTLDGNIRESKVWGQFFGYDWCWYIRKPKKNDRKRVRMKHYGKTWALTKEELL